MPRQSRPTLIAVTSDQHCGSTVALCPPRIELDDGGAYEASKAQRWLWECWQAFWQRAAEKRKQHGARLYQVFNGDAVEGHHHRNTHVIANNPNAQAAVWTQAVKVPLALSPDAMFFVRGTEAHVGGEAASEERIADGLRRDKRPIVSDLDTGTASWWHLRQEINGVRLDFAHHGRTGQREHTRANAAALHAYDIVLSHLNTGDPIPHLCVRSHYHRFNDSGDASPHTRVLTTGAFQLKTGHVHKVAADTLADIGGYLILVHNGRYDVEKVGFKAARGSVWRPAA